MLCIKCNVLIKDGTEKFLKCDGCNRPIHVSCSELSSAELKCFELRPSTKRRIKYICIECEQGLHQIPKILGLINELRNEIRELKDARASGAAGSISQDSPPPEQGICNEEIISEMMERSKRSQNVIIFGCVEEGTCRREQESRDVDMVQDILREVNLTEQSVNPVRLGKYDPTRENRSRPIKLRLTSPDCVSHIMRRFKKLKSQPRFSMLSVVPDRTPQQRSLYRQIRQELDRRLNDGEVDLKIKHVRGVPTIVSSKSEN